MRSLFCVLLILVSFNVSAGWGLRQVTINHIQAGNAEAFYMTVDGDVAAASGCQNMSGGKGWVSFDLSNMNERKKLIVSMAMAAYATGAKVDVGSTKSGCNTLNTADLQFIRVGDWKK